MQWRQAAAYQAGGIEPGKITGGIQLRGNEAGHEIGHPLGRRDLTATAGDLSRLLQRFLHGDTGQHSVLSLPWGRVLGFDGDHQTTVGER